MTNEERRPRSGSGVQDLGEEVLLSLPPVNSDDWRRAAEAVGGMFVAVVFIEGDRVRRYPCATLATAQRRVDRARERGHEASVILAELRPVFVLPGVVEGLGDV